MKFLIFEKNESNKLLQFLYLYKLDIKSKACKTNQSVLIYKRYWLVNKTTGEYDIEYLPFFSIYI